MSSDSEDSDADFDISLHSRSIELKKKKSPVRNADWLEDPLVKPFKLFDEVNHFYHTDPAETRKNPSSKLETTIQDLQIDKLTMKNHKNMDLTPVLQATSSASTRENTGTAHSTSNRPSRKISKKTKCIKKSLKQNKLKKAQQIKAKNNASTKKQTQSD